MHIVLISREFWESKRGGGIATYMRLIAEGMIERGHRVSVITASDDTREEQTITQGHLTIIFLSGADFILTDVEQSNLPFLKKFRLFYRFFSFRKKIRSIVGSLGQVDIIEVQEYGAEGLYLNDLSVPVVVRLQTPALLDRKTKGVKPFNLKNSPDWFTGYFENRVVKRAKYITACSFALKEWADEFIGFQPVLEEVIYNPVKIYRLPTEGRDIFEEPLRMIYAGTVSEEKGVGDLIQAMRILRNNEISITLDIAGKLGSYGKQLLEDLTSPNAEWCTFHGHVSKPELMDLYSNASMACFPSWWEAMGLVCVEAMYAGPIVIGSNSGGMVEIIEDGKDGFLVDPKSPEEIAAKIIQIIQLPKEEKIRISHAAQEKVLKLFSVEYVAEQTDRFYAKVLKDYNKA
jgi:glycosyltransferase involved in cell wall biosynthesis